MSFYHQDDCENWKWGKVSKSLPSNPIKETDWGDYITFNEAPIHSIIIWGNDLKFIKLADAIPNVKLHKQPPNCFDLQKDHYCVLGAMHKVKVVKKIEDFIEIEPEEDLNED